MNRGLVKGKFLPVHASHVPVRPHFVKKICFYGPESTGKSVLCEKMARYYRTEFVPEVARELISSNEFSAEDIIRIGKAQTARVHAKSLTANRVLFCDTDLITTQIYSEFYLKEVPSVLFELEREVKYDLYFLFDIDVPWVKDGLRDLGDKRKEMFQVFREALEKRGILYVLIDGTYEQREAKVKARIDALLLS